MRIKTIGNEEIEAWAVELHNAGKTIVLTNGCFDILHRGHVEYLNASSKLGDHLIIGINGDESVRKLKGPGRPVNSAEDRAYLLSNLSCVSGVFIFESLRLNKEILKIRPDVYTKAGDYSLDILDPEEREALICVGSTVVFEQFVKGYSTTSILSSLTS